MTKKILLFLCVFCILFNLSFITSFAASKAQGYAVYRDGSGINLNWHTGFIYSTNYEVIHAVSTNKTKLIIFSELDDFIKNQDFFGYYIPHKFVTSSNTTANNIKNKVLTTADQLEERTKDDLGYNLIYQVWYKTDKDNDKKVGIDEIISMRCDGLIEYCYELNGATIYGSNISTFDKTIRNDHSGTRITPKKQATLYMQNCLGDINYDYKVTAADARLAMQYSSQLETDYDAYQFFVADVNGDKVLTAADSRLILQYSSNLIDIFPADPLSN